MKFDKRPRYPVPEMSDRAKTMFENKPKRERTKLDKKIPLLADLVEVDNELTVEQEEDRRRNSFMDWEKQQRQAEARKWLDVRAAYFKCTKEQRAEIKARWDAWRGKRSSSYLLYVVELVNGESQRRREAIIKNDLRIKEMVLKKLSMEQASNCTQNDLFGGAA